MAKASGVLRSPGVLGSDGYDGHTGWRGSVCFCFFTAAFFTKIPSGPGGNLVCVW